MLQYLADCEEIPEEVTYQQRISTDRAKLTTLVEPKTEFIDNISSLITRQTRHSYTAKAQTKYMMRLKAYIKPKSEIIVQGYLAENFSYVVQDEIQSFIGNRQATIHPFVIYTISLKIHPLNTKMFALSVMSRNTTRVQFIHFFKC